MRILVVTNLFHPDRGGGASVFSDLCYGLAERGHDVAVYTSYPYYPEWTNKSNAPILKIREEAINGVRIYRHRLYVPRNPSKLLPRVLYELSFALSLTRNVFRRKRFDAVMVFCPMAGAVAYASFRKFIRREPVWLNIQDIPADAAAASGISQSGFMNRIGNGVQSLLFNRGDVWSSIAPGMIERLKAIRGRHQTIHYCPNFLNQSVVDVVAEHDLNAKVGRPVSDPIKLLYAGNIGKKQGLLEFCKVLSETALDFRFRIHGNGSEADNVQKWAESSSDQRFEFGDFLEEKDFIKALIDTDLFVITEKSGSGASFIPSKLIPCMATGTPVFCTCDEEGPLGAEVTQFQLGVCLPWSDIGSVVDRLTEAARKQSGFTQMQRNAIERSRFYTRATVIDTVEQGLHELIESRQKR